MCIILMENSLIKFLEKFHSSLEESEDANTFMGLKIIFKIDIVGIRIKVLLDKN